MKGQALDQQRKLRAPSTARYSALLSLAMLPLRLS